ncbi:tryptophan-rich sensory protein [Cytobacillus purgationiresistens]|uniref:Tryptophan-rich sensory protein n=1 Tax=Cytobacillus purgationiresistens TaxID=863449 RepID=A0ABU0AC37_9BACI|nr:tryptophan-rich sensory protein [Cytobacillus purgationiresistens]MDQ0268444.1 hypothetical protein [Cytobacillus purgationiresistens]
MKGCELLLYLLSILAYAFMITMNLLAHALPINGQTTSEVSNKLNVLFTPAGYVFMIWGLIYLMLAIWLMRQGFPSKRNLPIYKKIYPIFILSSLLNGIWIVTWHYELFLLSIIIIVSLLITLIVLYRNLNISGIKIDMATFSIYLGWVSVATIANISYYLTYINWNGWGLSNTIWTIIMLSVAMVIAIYILVKYHDWLYPLVFVWAIIGIAIRNMDQYYLVTFTAFVYSFVLFLLTIILSIRRKPL